MTTATPTATLHALQTSGTSQLPTSAPLVPRDTAVAPGFNSAANWDLAQRIAKAFASADLVPPQYRGNIANCLIALEMANRMGASPLMVMQNLYVVHGTPGWSAKFLIACFNQCGKFSALRYEFDTRDGKQVACRAWAIEKSTGERLVGATVSLEMAKAEGWSEKSGSKWRTMAEQMMMYRAAAFMIRTYAPEISMGLRTVDEIADNVIDLDEATVGDLRSAPAGGAGAPSSDPAPVGGVVATPAENAPGAHSDGSGEQGPADPFVEDLNRAERAENQRRRK